MANETRLHHSFQGGRITDNPLAMGSGTMNSNELIDFPTVDSYSYAAITLDPAGINPEIVWITSHTIGQPTANILRGRETTSAQQHNLNTRWVHAPTAWDHNYPKNAMSRIYARQNFR